MKINNLFDKVSLIQGLENSGFEVNQELVKFYTDFNSKRAEMSIESQSWSLTEPPVDNYSAELLANAKSFSDVACVVLAWAASEGHNDLPMLSTYGAGPNLPHDAANPSASTVKYLRTASKNIMYVVVNSWEYENNVDMGGMPGWQKMIIGADVAAGVVLVALEALIIKKYLKKTKKEK